MLNAYLDELCWMDYSIILPFGIILILMHLFYLLARLNRVVWAVQGLEIRRRFLLMLSEILPLLGLLGTVLGLLQTFRAIEGSQSGSINIYAIIRDFAPALTTTASGIIMLIPNLFLNGVLWLLAPVKKDEEE